MTGEVTIKGGARLNPHPLRAAILGEVHARPFTAITTPRRLIHFAFATPGEAGRNDRAALAAFCARRKLEPLDAVARHHRVAFDDVTLRWEQHSEFTTFTWIRNHAGASRPFGDVDDELAALIGSLPQAGQLLVALKLEVEETSAAVERAERLFEKGSLAMVNVRSGQAVVASDFRVDEQGNPLILEVNPNPSLDVDAGFAAACAEAGYDYGHALEKIIAAALQ